MAAKYRVGIARRLVNRVIRLLLRVGIGPPRTYLLTVRGKKTGRMYSTPVTLVERSGQRWLVAPYGDVAWVRNARAAGDVTLTRGRRAETVRLAELGPEDAAPILKQYITEIPITRPFFDVRPESPLADFAAEAPRHPVFRLLSAK